MKKGAYRLCSVFLAALIVSVVVAPVCAVETDYFSKDTFWRWMAGSGGVVQKIIGYSFSSACSASDDGYHHASSYTREGKDGTYQCNCIYCGDVFIATESDIKQSYDNYVETLPATGYTSDGSLQYSPVHDYFELSYSSGSAYGGLARYCEHHDGEHGEVITVDDLLDRITSGDQSGEGTGDGEEETPPQEEEEPPLPGNSGEAPPAGEALEGPIEVVGMETVLKRLETLQGVADHPMMETPFEDYTVTEGLLLLLLLSVFLSVCAKLLKGGFAWLR